MKKLLLVVMLMPLLSFGQKLVEDKTDDFTKASVKRTSWEELIRSSKWYLFFRTSKIDNSHYLNMKMILEPRNRYYTIDKGNELMLMLENDSVLRLYNLEYTVACKGCGAKGFGGSSAVGIELNYFLSAADIAAIKSNPVKKIRVYTDKGFVEDEVKEKYGVLFLNMVNLLD